MWYTWRQQNNFNILYLPRVLMAVDAISLCRFGCLGNPSHWMERCLIGRDLIQVWEDPSKIRKSDIFVILWYKKF